MVKQEIPIGYIPGMSRCTDGNKRVSHLYKGTFDDPGFPMCNKGWNRDNGDSYSIFRNNISKKGVCKVCLKRANLNLNSISK